MKPYKPYKVVPYEPQAADVIDRATGEKVGYVLRWAKGWAAYLTSAAGEELPFGRKRWPTEHARRIMGEFYEAKYTRYRADAAAKVWETWAHNHPAPSPTPSGEQTAV